MNAAVVNLDDRLVLEGRQDLHFPLETSRAIHRRREHFDRNLSAEQRILGQEHLARRATPERPLHLIAPQGPSVLRLELPRLKEA